MTDLRQQLQRAKTEYENLRYPGDLAGDVLPATAGRIWPRIATFAAVAVAAVVAVAIWLNTPAHPQNQQVVIGTPKAVPVTPVAPKAPDVSVANNTTEEVTPEYPDGVTIVPTMESMGLSQVPSMPSFDEMMSSSTATTREAS
jgi:hypothetical protein